MAAPPPRIGKYAAGETPAAAEKPAKRNPPPRKRKVRTMKTAPMARPGLINR